MWKAEARYIHLEIVARVPLDPVHRTHEDAAVIHGATRLLWVAAGLVGAVGGEGEG